MLQFLKDLTAVHKPKEKKLFLIEDVNPQVSTKDNSNLHVREFLRYYLSLAHSPYYAVLVSGVWGIGKTHLVRSTLKKLLGDTSYSYVSLYGLDNVDAIDVALYQSLHPALSSKSAKIAGRAGKAALKFARIDGAFSIKDFIDLGKNRLYVFDDLERSILKPEVTLGYINELVEHDGCKVIIIGNEEKLLEIPGYRETREKLIGRTLEVQPEIESAFTHFLTQVTSTRVIKALEVHAQTVTLIFGEASSRNFRILQQTIWDFERVADCLDELHFASSEGMKTLIEMFFAISLEVKAGKLEKRDLTERPDGLLRAMMQNRNADTEQSLDIADKRFSEANLYDSILSNEVLSDLLFKGIINRDLVRESVNRSSCYVNVDSEPAWRTVWYGFEREETVFNTALDEMELQFKERKITEPGVILHIVGLRLWLSEIGVLSPARKEILDQGKNYIKDLYTSKLLSAPTDRGFGGDSYQGYDGLGMHELEAADFRDFMKYLEGMQQQVAVDLYPEQARKLLDDMELEAELFFRKVCFTNDKENIYASTPLLAIIPPKEFVGRVIRLHAASRRKVIMALNIRYAHGNLERYVPAEKEWLIDVSKEFYLVLESLTPMGRWSVANALGQYLDTVVPKPENPVESGTPK